MSMARETDQCVERQFTDRKDHGSNATSASRLPLSRLGQPGSILLDWARGCGRDFEENSCGSAITLGMTVPCHHCTDMLRFMDSPVTVVKGAAIGEGIRSSVAAGSGQWILICLASKTWGSKISSARLAVKCPKRVELSSGMGVNNRRRKIIPRTIYTK
ncbi:hypothetical protein CSKR_101492 [Clonorchis sinensis]|uniref:Uncharacterized protein n=1 Tax=Clonorchis sinensis TaxID=79923 RepID=A0A3R7D603_CLOSI|nr:hypothetical protein CSKR_101492 [Clonorchis sinensis]